MATFLILLGIVTASAALFGAGFVTGGRTVVARQRALALAERQRKDAYLAGIASKKPQRGSIEPPAYPDYWNEVH